MRYETIPLSVPGAQSPAALTAYLPDNFPDLGPDRRRPALIICPGGAYRKLSNREGEPVALRFAGLGYAAFVLYYHVAPQALYPIPQRQLLAAIDHVRSHGEEYHVVGSAVIPMGFSAGGHLAGCAANLWGHPVLAPLGLAPEWMRPDACVLCYPVITAQPPYGSTMSFQNLLGEGVLVPSQLSLESAVTGDTPPTFLWATVGDNTVPVENTMLYATALRRAGVPFELHLYGDGPHAMGLATAESVWRPDYVNPHAATWHGLCVEWMKGLK